MEGEASGLPGPIPERGDASGKFTPIDLSAHFNSSSREFGPCEKAALIGGESAKDSLIRVPAGKRDLQGIPFMLGPEDLQSKSWLVLSAKSGPTAAARVEIPLGKKANFLCVASFCDFDENESPQPGQDVFQKVGQRLADVTLVYEDGGTCVLPIRRRFETNAALEFWGHVSFAAMAPGKLCGTSLTDPLANATEWGFLQRSIGGSTAGSPGMGIVWVCSLKNPAPRRAIRSVHMEAASEDALVICGLTLFHRATHPLRTEPRAIYRIALPEPAAEDIARWKVDVDLGTIGRTFALPDFDPEAWLAAPAKGLGEETKAGPGARYLYAEVIANFHATLTLTDSKTGKSYSFELAQVIAGGETPASEGGGRIEIVERGRRWVHFRVLDADTHQPTPVRLAVRSKEGRYIPPYGHRADINDEWFQDYGADVELMGTSFAYVDGTF